MLFHWFGETLWPWLEKAGVYYASVLVILLVASLCFDGIRTKRPGVWLATGFWFALARWGVLLLSEATGLRAWYLGIWVPWMVLIAFFGNTLLVIILDGTIKEFWVRSWWTALALGALLSFTDVVGHALFKPAEDVQITACNAPPPSDVGSRQPRLEIPCSYL